MRNMRVNYLMVGTFVLTMLAGLVVSLALLTGRTGAVDRYHAHYRNVSGVKFGTQVLYEGYPVGQVEEIVPEGAGGRMRFRIEMSIRRGWKIPEDSTAEIAASGLLSAVVIGISAGGSETALAAGNEIPGREGANIFAVMSSVAAEIRDLAESDIKPLLGTLRGTVGSIGHILDAEGQDLVHEARSLVTDLSRRTPVIIDNVEKFTHKLTAASDHLNAVLTPQNQAKMQKMIDNMDVTATNFSELSRTLEKLVHTLDTLVAENRQNVDKSLAEARYVMDSVTRHIDSINQNMEGTARNMYEFSRQIRQNPGLLLTGTPPPDEGRSGPSPAASRR